MTMNLPVENACVCVLSRSPLRRISPVALLMSKAWEETTREASAKTFIVGMYEEGTLGGGGEVG